MSHTLESVFEYNSPRNSSSTALPSIPLSAWENETPVFEILIREAIRLSQPFVAFRRNVGPEMYIDGKVIPTGSLVVHPAASVHLYPALYPDPWKFDPARPQPKGNLAYLGWGGGLWLRLHLSPGWIFTTDVDDTYIYIYMPGAWTREYDLHRLAACVTKYQTRCRATAHEL
jgi:cytochrome P450